MKLKKVGFVFYGNPNDTKYWSGTVARLHSILEKSSKIELKDIVIQPNMFAKLIKKMVKFFSLGKNEFSFLINFASANKVNKMINESDCDYFFAPACSQLIFSGKRAFKNKKLIYLSDATYHKMVGYYYFHSAHDQRIGNAWERKAHELSDSIILPANWAVEDAVNYYGTPREKINIIKFGANLDDCGFKYFESGKSTYRLLLVGVEYVRKGVDVAIETVKLLNEKNDSVKFELSVVGLDKPDLDIPDYIHFYGKLRKSKTEELKKLIEMYSNHDIFILPTKAECSAIVFAEASMFGMPVFTYATGGTTDYVENGVTGRCLDPKCGPRDFCDAISDAIENNKMEYYSVNARKKYENELNWNHWLEQFEAIIEKN